jgi:hypothetical protein
LKVRGKEPPGNKAGYINSADLYYAATQYRKCERRIGAIMWPYTDEETDWLNPPAMI